MSAVGRQYQGRTFRFVMTGVVAILGQKRVAEGQEENELCCSITDALVKGDPFLQVRRAPCRASAPQGAHRAWRTDHYTKKTVKQGTSIIGKGAPRGGPP